MADQVGIRIHVRINQSTTRGSCSPAKLDRISRYRAAMRSVSSSLTICATISSGGPPNGKSSLRLARTAFEPTSTSLATKCGAVAAGGQGHLPAERVADPRGVADAERLEDAHQIGAQPVDVVSVQRVVRAAVAALRHAHRPMSRSGQDPDLSVPQLMVETETGDEHHGGARGAS